VLCAQPTADLRFLLAVLLDRHGFDSDSASTIAEAAAMASAGDYCLYVVDDRYDDGTGPEMIRRLREATPAVPVLAFSALSFERDMEEALRAGASAYLLKPNDFGAIAETVKHLCGAA
jgi:DNA-binding response OmpR family regulator